MKTLRLFVSLLFVFSLTADFSADAQIRKKVTVRPHLSTLIPVSVSFIPEESGTIVFQEMAPPKKGGKTTGQLSISMTIKNNGSKAIQLEKVEMSNSQVTKNWTVDLSDKEKSPNPIPSGKSTRWQNGRGYNVMGDVLPLSTPFPTSQTIKLYFKGYSNPMVFTKPLKPYRGQALQFPGRAEHLAVNEYWSGKTLHGSGGSQVFGLDLGVTGWDGKKWSSLYPGKNKSKNSNYRCYGKPVYAMDNGTVLAFKNTHNENPNPPAKIEYENVEGNHFWIDHGDLVVLYAHFQKGSLNKKLIKKGAKVKKGDFLGLMGNSGNSTAPHLHLHVTTGNKTWSRDFRPMRIYGADVVEKSQMPNPNYTQNWGKLSNRNLPKNEALIRPSVGLGWKEYTRHGLKGNYYQGEFDKVARAGYYPIWVNGYELKGTTYHNVIFRPSKGLKWVAYHGVDASKFQKDFTKWTKAGYRPVHVDSYISKGKVKYASVYVKKSGPGFKVYHGANKSVHNQRFNQWSKQGWTPTHISVVSVSNKPYYTAIYEKKNVKGFYHLSGLSGSEFQKQYDQKAKQGFQPVYIDVGKHGGSNKFSAIWYKTPPFQSHAARHGLSGGSFQQQFDKNVKAGMTSRCIAGYESGGKSYFAGLWTKNIKLMGIKRIKN